MWHKFYKITKRTWRNNGDLMALSIILILVVGTLIAFRHKIFGYGPVIGAKEENNSWDWVAFVLATTSCLVAIAMAIWQYRTERNTVKISLSGQVELLADYVRHSYANLVITEAIMHKHQAAGLNKFYPSEEHFLKLQTDTDPLHPEIFYRNIEKYNSIHNLLLFLRNYNIETEVACKHMCDPTLPVEAKVRDYKTLEFKPNLFAKSIYDCIAKLQDDTKVERSTVKKIRESIIEAAVRRQELDYEKDEQVIASRAECVKNALKLAGKVLPAETTEAKDIIAYGKEHLKKEQMLQADIATIKTLTVEPYVQSNNGKHHNIAQFFFSDDPELFYTLINANIRHEITGENASNGAKIFLIPFKQ